MTTYGPAQLRRHLGLARWQFARARELGLIPNPDAGDDQWSEIVANNLLADRTTLVDDVGSVPDLGAVRMAAELTQLVPGLDVEIDGDTVAELARQQHIRIVGYRHDCAVYDGLAAEAFAGLRNAPDIIAAAAVAGHLYMRDAAAAYLGIRPCAFDALERPSLVVAHTFVRSRWQGRSATPAVPVFRHGDLDELLADESLPWEAERQAKPGSRTPFADLPIPTRKS